MAKVVKAEPKKVDPKKAEQAKTEDKSGFAFGPVNFILLGAGILLVIAGFALMWGGATKDPNVFSEEVFSARRITVAPLVVLTGFAVNILAIMIKSKN